MMRKHQSTGKYHKSSESGKPKKTEKPYGEDSLAVLRKKFKRDDENNTKFWREQAESLPLKKQIIKDLKSKNNLDNADFEFGQIWDMEIIGIEDIFRKYGVFGEQAIQDYVEGKTNRIVPIKNAIKLYRSRLKISCGFRRIQKRRNQRGYTWMFTTYFTEAKAKGLYDLRLTDKEEQEQEDAIRKSRTRQQKAKKKREDRIKKEKETCNDDSGVGRGHEVFGKAKGIHNFQDGQQEEQAPRNKRIKLDSNPSLDCVSNDDSQTHVESVRLCDLQAVPQDDAPWALDCAQRTQNYPPWVQGIEGIHNFQDRQQEEQAPSDELTQLESNPSLDCVSNDDSQTHVESVRLRDLQAVPQDDAPWALDCAQRTKNYPPWVQGIEGIHNFQDRQQEEQAPSDELTKLESNPSLDCVSNDDSQTHVESVRLRDWQDELHNIVLDLDALLVQVVEEQKIVQGIEGRKIETRSEFAFGQSSKRRPSCSQFVSHARFAARAAKHLTCS